MRASAEFDLTFFYGDGSTMPGSWGATAGLRSSMGLQLERMRDKIYGRSGRSVDPSAVESQMIDRLGETTWARQIGHRLSMLPPLVQEVLRLHYSGTHVHAEVDGSALALPQARQLVLSQIYRAAWQALKDAKKRRRKGEDTRGPLGLVRRLRDDAKRVRRGFGPDTLRDALQRAPASEIADLAELASLTLASAKEAYESTVLPKQPRRVA